MFQPLGCVLMLIVLTSNKCKVLLICPTLTPVSEEKQKSDADAEEDGTVSQEEEDRKPKAEVIGKGAHSVFQTAKLRVHSRRGSIFIG